MGLTGYYRRFIKGYVALASPLTSLLKKDAFVWSPKASEAFLTLKHAITSAPVLAFLETDASGIGVGAVLSQAHHPIAYFSKQLTPRMQKQSAYSRELYAITEALAKFHHYLLGHKFIIRTDQRSLKSLTEQTIQTPEQQAWLHKFLGYHFTIEYKSGKDNLAADALSRSFFMAISAPDSEFLSKIQRAVANDPQLAVIRDQCLHGKPPDPNYQVSNNLLYWKSRLVLPQKPEIIALVLNEFHSSPIGGHSGVASTKVR